jgi:hypothetical protein
MLVCKARKTVYKLIPANGHTKSMKLQEVCASLHTKIRRNASVFSTVKAMQSAGDRLQK